MRIQSGFSIVELMIVITIAGILAAIGIPGYQNMVKNNCMTTNANTLISSLQFARSEAVRNRSPVSLAAINATAANEWGNGWRIGTDGNGDSTIQDSELIRIVELTCGQTMLDETGNVQFFTYRPTGFLDTGTPSGTIRICDDRTGERGREITIAPTGRPSINSDYTCS